MTFADSVAGARAQTPPPESDEATLVDDAVARGQDPNSDSMSRADVLAVTAFVTAVAAAFSGAAPTGTAWWDATLAAALGVAVVVASTRAHTYALVAASGLAAMFVGITPWLAVALIGLGMAMALVAQPDRKPMLAPVSAGLGYLGLLHLGDVGFFGSSALIAGIAIVAVLGSGYRRSGPAVQARIRSVVVGLGLALAVLFVVAAYLAVSIRASGNAGVQAARSGLASARAGDTQALSAELERAQQLLADADAKVSSPFLKPLAAVPVAAQHLRSLSTATEQGLVVATEAVTISRDANLEELQLRAGQFDLDLLAEMGPNLERAASSLEETIDSIAADRSPWLLPPIDRQLQSLSDDAADVLPETRLAADAAAVMPGMLGADGERRYLMFFGSPGESREFGGFIGGYALLRVLDGGLDLLDAGSINELVEFANDNGAELDRPEDYPAIFVAAEPAVYPQNLTSSPNITLIADAVRDVFPEVRGAPIDGVIYADPFTLAAMTEFTGPLRVDGVDEPLDQDGVTRFIFEGQYTAYENRDERFGAMGALAAETAANFEGIDLPGPERLGEVLGPVARAGRLQIATYNEDENAFLASVKLQRNFQAPTDIDSFALIQTNGSPSKLDLYLHRSVRYEVSIDDDGQLTAIVDVDLRSIMPDDVPPLTLGETDGTNQVLLSLYTPHQLLDLSVNGGRHEFVTHEEFGFLRHALFKIPLPPNGVASVRFSLRGEAPEGPYQLGVWSQPLVNNDDVEVILRPANGSALQVGTELVENWLAQPLRDGTQVD